MLLLSNSISFLSRFYNNSIILFILLNLKKIVVVEAVESEENLQKSLLNE